MGGGQRLEVQPRPVRGRDGAAHALLVLAVEGVGDSSIVREAVARWGESRVHLDVAAGLEAGVPDDASLGFIAFLRRSGWTAKRIEATLGGTLRKSD